MANPIADNLFSPFIPRLMPPSVSVIIPNYNHAPFLKQRFQSILNQTFQDFEIIYLDDASTDNSNQIMSEFLDSDSLDRDRVKTVFNQENTGNPFKQWNTGIQLAQGHYIWLAESDDYADPLLLEKLVEMLDRNASVGLAYCQSNIVDETGQLLFCYKDYTDNHFDREKWSTDFVNDGKAECAFSLSHTNTIPNASAVLLRRNVFEQIGGADTEKRLCGDWSTWVRMLLESDVAFVAAPLNYFRMHTGTTRSRLIKQLTYAEESYQIFQFLTANLSISETAYETACQGLFDRWLEGWSSSTDADYLHQFQRIYELANHVDSHLANRLVGQLRSTQVELERSRAQITAIESSKFWKLRDRWLKFKGRLELS